MQSPIKLEDSKTIYDNCIELTTKILTKDEFDKRELSKLKSEYTEKINSFQFINKENTKLLIEKSNNKNELIEIFKLTESEENKIQNEIQQQKLNEEKLQREKEQNTPIEIPQENIQQQSTQTQTINEISIDTSNMTPHEAFEYIIKEKNINELDKSRWAEIIRRESSWNHTVSNPYSGAYGLPQALPPQKMESHGSDWATNPLTQLRWMYDYMTERYGSISGALDFWDANHWY